MQLDLSNLCLGRAPEQEPAPLEAQEWVRKNNLERFHVHIPVAEGYIMGYATMAFHEVGEGEFERSLAPWMVVLIFQEEHFSEPVVRRLREAGNPGGWPIHVDIDFLTEQVEVPLGWQNYLLPNDLRREMKVWLETQIERALPEWKKGQAWAMMQAVSDIKLREATNEKKQRDPYKRPRVSGRARFQRMLRDVVQYPLSRLIVWQGRWDVRQAERPRREIALVKTPLSRETIGVLLKNSNAEIRRIGIQLAGTRAQKGRTDSESSAVKR